MESIARGWPALLCGGKVQGSFAMKVANCMKCDFYQSPHYDKNYRG